MASLLTLTFSQPTLTLEAGDVLIKEGDRGGDIYVLESGRLSVARDGVVLAHITAPGALVGEMSVLLGTENTATVRAEKPSTLRVVKDALAYLERQPLVALRVAMLLSQRLDATSAALVELAKSKPEELGFYARLMATLTGDKD
jgi:CRP/FNR family cyclic AMP-dependent transcriptional regulator